MQVSILCRGDSDEYDLHQDNRQGKQTLGLLTKPLGGPAGSNTAAFGDVPRSSWLRMCRI